MKTSNKSWSITLNNHATSPKLLPPLRRLSSSPSATSDVNSTDHSFQARRMDPTVPTPPAASTVTESCISTQAPPSSAAAAGPNVQLLEISIISAQDLSAVSKSMHTYAVAWIQPNRKKTTKIDTQGHKNPTWNDKFAFKLDKELLSSENATVTVEIYTVSWFRDVLVGNVRVLISDLVTPLMRNPKSDGQGKTSTRFVALQVRRPSGNPQGILNMGVALLDSSMRSMTMKKSADVGGKSPAKKFDGEKTEETSADHLCGLDNNQQKTEQDPNQQEIIDDSNRDLNAKIHQWRAQSFATEMNPEDFPGKPGSIYNGSMVNGGDNISELCSDIGPSASVVAAELAMKMQPEQMRPAVRKQVAATEGDDTGSSILEELTIEEAKAKGYIVTTRDRWRKVTSAARGGGDGADGEGSELSISSKTRKGSDGLFSCFGNAYGIEFTIVCGASKNANKSSSSTKRKKLPPPPPSKANTA